MFHVGDVARKLRGDESLVDFAKRAALRPNAVSDFERQVKNYERDTLIKICRGLGKTPDELFGLLRQWTSVNYESADTKSLPASHTAGVDGSAQSDPGRHGVLAPSMLTTEAPNYVRPSQAGPLTLDESLADHLGKLIGLVLTAGHEANRLLASGKLESVPPGSTNVIRVADRPAISPKNGRRPRRNDRRNRK